jgi:hypothetical protein
MNLSLRKMAHNTICAVIGTQTLFNAANLRRKHGDRQIAVEH